MLLLLHPLSLALLHIIVLFSPLFLYLLASNNSLQLVVGVGIIVVGILHSCVCMNPTPFCCLWLSEITCA